MKKFIFTGNIAAGKTTLMSRLGRLTRIPCWNADNIVYRAFYNSRTFKQIQEIFHEDLLLNNEINFSQIRKEIRKNPKKLKELESILHPIVKREREKQLHLFKRQKRPAILLEIPLFFEILKGNKYKKREKEVFVFKAPLFLRKKRFLERKKANSTTFLFLEGQQMLVDKKKAKGGKILYTGLSQAISFRNLLRAYKTIRK